MDIDKINEVFTQFLEQRQDEKALTALQSALCAFKHDSIEINYAMGYPVLRIKNWNEWNGDELSQQSYNQLLQCIEPIQSQFGLTVTVDIQHDNWIVVTVGEEKLDIEAEYSELVEEKK